MSEFNGGKFISGFASGVVSSLVSSGVEALGNSSVKLEGVMPTGIGGTFLPEFSTFASRNPGLFRAIMLVSGGLPGGISSSIAGGKFIDGLKQGLITAGLNHVAHKIDSDLDYADGGKKGSGGAANDAHGDVLNWFNESDGGLYKVAQNDPGVAKGTVRVYTHGNAKGIAGPNGEWMTTPDQIDKVLMERSPTWKNYRENGGTIRLELMSCNTGRWSNGIASKISQAFRFSAVIAPNNYFVAARDGSRSWVAGQYNLINPSRWNYFINGQNLTRSLYDIYKR